MCGYRTHCDPEHVCSPWKDLLRFCFFMAENRSLTR